MKIEMELKDNPRGRPTIKVAIDNFVHGNINVQTLVSITKKHYPWVKIINLRIDLR